MSDLIERLEKSTGPDRQLDRLIEETLPGVLRHPYSWQVEDAYVISGHGHLTYSPGQGYLPAHYTASIDAALTLVPDGMAWTLGQNVHHRYWQACVNTLDEEGAPSAVGFSGHQDLKSPAIALCIAALKARAILSSHSKDASR